MELRRRGRSMRTLRGSPPAICCSSVKRPSGPSGSMQRGCRRRRRGLSGRHRHRSRDRNAASPLSPLPRKVRSRFEWDPFARGGGSLSGRSRAQGNGAARRPARWRCFLAVSGWLSDCDDERDDMGNLDVYLLDTRRDRFDRLTTHVVEDGFPVWSRKQSHPRFFRTETAKGSLRNGANRRTEAQPLDEGVAGIASTITDGQFLLFQPPSATRAYLWNCAPRTGEPSKLIETEFDERGSSSPQRQVDRVPV